jgi:hypothetical protein
MSKIFLRHTLTKKILDIFGIPCLWILELKIKNKQKNPFLDIQFYSFNPSFICIKIYPACFICFIVIFLRVLYLWKYISPRKNHPLSSYGLLDISITEINIICSRYIC